MTNPLHHISTAEEFTALLSSTLYLVADFYADWCGPCRAIAPSYAQLAKSHAVPGYLAFAKVNVDAAQAVAAQYGVSAMPTFMFFKEGRQVAVNGDVTIQGADVRRLSAAAEKMGRLAKEKSVAAAGAKI